MRKFKSLILIVVILLSITVNASAAYVNRHVQYKSPNLNTIDGFWAKMTVPTLDSKWSTSYSSNKANAEFWFVIKNDWNWLNWVEMGYKDGRGYDPVTKKVDYKAYSGLFAAYYVHNQITGSEDMIGNEIPGWSPGQSHTMGATYVVSNGNANITMSSDGAVKATFNGKPFGNNRNVSCGLEHGYGQSTGWYPISPNPLLISEMNLRLNGTWNLAKNVNGSTFLDDHPNVNGSFDTVNNRVILY